MDIKAFEDLIKTEISVVITKVLMIFLLPIDVRQGERVGDAISKFLETKFVEYTQEHFYFKNSSISC